MIFDLLNREMQIKQFKATEWKQRNIIFNNLLNILQFKFVVEKQYLKKQNSSWYSHQVPELFTEIDSKYSRKKTDLFSQSTGYLVSFGRVEFLGTLNILLNEFLEKIGFP